MYTYNCISYVPTVGVTVETLSPLLVMASILLVVGHSLDVVTGLELTPV